MNQMKATTETISTTTQYISKSKRINRLAQFVFKIFLMTKDSRGKQNIRSCGRTEGTLNVNENKYFSEIIVKMNAKKKR